MLDARVGVVAVNDCTVGATRSTVTVSPANAADGPVLPATSATPFAAMRGTMVPSVPDPPLKVTV